MSWIVGYVYVGSWGLERKSHSETNEWIYSSQLTAEYWQNGNRTEPTLTDPIQANTFANTPLSLFP